MKNGKRHIIQSYAYPILSILMLLQCVVAETDKDALPKVEEGFEINFFVKEPHIINPSALCFDKLGRLYVGAGPQYRGPKPDSPTDYIKILIDDDRDGAADCDDDDCLTDGQDPDCVGGTIVRPLPVQDAELIPQIARMAGSSVSLWDFPTSARISFSRKVT